MDDLEALYLDEWFADEDDLDSGYAETFEVTPVFFDDGEDDLDSTADGDRLDETTF